MLRAATVFIVTSLLAVLAPATAAEAAGASWSISPQTHEFGPRLIGTGPSAPAVFTLTNTGTVPLRAPYLTYGLPLDEYHGTAKFEMTNHCHGELAPGASCAIEITFEPTAIGPDYESFALDEPEAQVGSLLILVAGEAAEPKISFSPPALFLTSRLLGIELNPPAVLTVSNTGSADLHISGLSLIDLGTDPVNPNQFKIVGGSCGIAATLAAGGSCTIQVTYTPAQMGFLRAGLEFADNVPGKHEGTYTPESRQTVELIGNGAAFRAEKPVPLATYISLAPPQKLRRTWARFRFGVAGGGTAFVCKLDAGPYRACASPRVYRHLSPGRHVFRVRPRKPGPSLSGIPAVARFRVLPPAVHRP